MGKIFTSLDAVVVAKVVSSKRQTHKPTQSTASKATSSAKMISVMDNLRMVVKLLVLKLVI